MVETLIPAGPLQIDAVATPAGGAIGMVHCPGRCVSPWQRDLEQDLASIRDWRAELLISLVEAPEFARLGVPDLPKRVRATGLDWLHLPIADMQVPGGEFDRTWRTEGARVLGRLESGRRIVLHCAAGLGRTGMIAAKLLIALGATGPAAVTAVRAARPGTIETEAQERFVLAGRSLRPV